MAETHVISALVEKRARVDGAIKVRRFQIMRLEVELAQLDAVIRMFKPEYDVEAILPKRSFTKNPAGVKKGAGGRQALTVLRETGAALTSSEIAERVLIKLGKPVTAEAILPMPLPADFKFPLPKEIIGGNNLGSLQDGHFSARVPYRVNDADVEAIKSGRAGMGLYVWGIIFYEDMFKKRRQTQFAQFLYWTQTGEIRENGHRPETVRGYHLERHSRTT